MTETQAGNNPSASPIPSSVRTAVWLLSIAWLLSVALTIFNFFLFRSPLQSLGVSVQATLSSICALLVQAIAIYFIARGSNVARIVALIFLLLATPGFFFIMWFMSTVSLLSVSLSTVGYTLRLIAIFLLFGPHARPWFRRVQSSPSVA